MVRTIFETRAVLCVASAAFSVALGACSHGEAKSDEAPDEQSVAAEDADSPGDAEEGASVETSISDKPDSGWKQLALSSEVACALAKDGGVWCWGAEKLYPQRVDLDVPVERLVSSSTMTCGLTEKATVCWPTGDFDDASKIESGVLRQSDGLDGLSVEHQMACGVTDGSARCWGGFVELDHKSVVYDVSFTDLRKFAKQKPKDISLENPITSVSVGGYHACALDKTGQVFCWGKNLYGQLGDGTTESRSEPAPIKSKARFKSISAGWVHTCGITTDDKLFCWGGERLPHESKPNKRGGEAASVEARAAKGKPEPLYKAHPIPEPVARGDFKSVAAGRDHTCAIDRLRAAKCWGDNAKGQLGHPSPKRSEVPVSTAARATFAHLASGPFYTCGIADSDSILCWGDSSDGQTGDSFPKLTRNDEAWKENGKFGGVSRVWQADPYDYCVLTKDGKIGCEDSPGAVVSKKLAERLEAAEKSRRRRHRRRSGELVTVEGTYRDFAASGVHLCLLDSAGELACTGDNSMGQLGQGSGVVYRKQMAPTGGGTKFAQVDASRGHTCGLTGDGELYCWGLNAHGQTGNSKAKIQWQPAKVDMGTRARRIATGFEHTCALTSSAKVLCWGRNDFGQLGDGTTADKHQPTRVVDIPGVSTIASTGKHTCALNRAGKVFCWGANYRFQVAPQKKEAVSKPVEVELPEKVNRLALNYEVSCAATKKGKVYCWGDMFGKKPKLVYEDPSLVSLHGGTKGLCMIDKEGLFGCLGNRKSFDYRNFTAKPVAVEFE